ncbi:MAG TPA: hypothetical protein VE010_14215, partial [Thermoanaerobaculia bacterium]|nr:hypothetical protein [Thermoanaerobaculia bacterium]
ERLILPWITNPFAAATVPADALTAYLQKQSDHLTAIRHLIDEGLCVAAKRTIDPNDRKQVAARAKLFEELDALSRLKKEDELKPRIEPLFAAFDAQFERKSGAELAEARERRTPTVEQLMFRVTAVSVLGWVVVVTVTVITGYAVLIANDRGFGSIGDLLLCFVWGAGVQAAGQQLSTTTTSSVFTALGVTKSSTPD